jgi:hypothetical protein
MFTKLCGGATVSATAHDLTAALSDPMISSILLNIDSPGGEANGISELAAMIRAGASIKPIVAYVGNQAASAGYWLASAANEIVISDTAMLGSIGVIMAMKTRDDRPGERSYTFVSSVSPNKALNPDTEIGRSGIQKIIDDLADVFVGAVAEYRGVTPEAVAKDFGGGSMLTGRNAVSMNMADRIGSFEGVLSELAAGPSRPRSGFSVAASGLEVPSMGLFSGFLIKPQADGSTEMRVISADNENPEPAAIAPATFAAEPKTDPGLDAELTRLRAELASEREKRIKATADGWYSSLLAANKIVPAEKEGAIAAYVQAALDDLASPLASGAARTTNLDSIYSARPGMGLTSDRVAAARAISSRYSGPDDDDDIDVAAEVKASLDRRAQNGRINLNK